MRVCVIHLGRRAVGGHVLQLAKALSKKAEVCAVLSQNSDALEPWRGSGIPIVVVDTFQSYGGAFVSCVNQPRLRRLASDIRGLQPDVLLTYMVHPWTPFIERYLRDIPHVVTVHDPAAHPGIVHALSSSWEALSARHAARSVVMSKMFIGALKNRGVPAERIDVIPHGVLSLYKSDSTNAKEERNPNLVLFFGRITTYKGLDILLRAFLQVVSHVPAAKLEVVGEGDISPYLRLLAESDSVRVVNRWVADDEVGHFFRRAAVVVLPYTSATQSGVAAIAAAFGVPVIATRVGALPDQIEDGRSGLLVEPGSVNQLADAIERLLRNPDAGIRMGRQLAEDFDQKCNWDRISELFLESCRKAIGN